MMYRIVSIIALLLLLFGMYVIVQNDSSTPQKGKAVTSNPNSSFNDDNFKNLKLN